MELGRQEEALAEYRKGLDIDQQSSDSDKGNSMWQRDLAVSHNKVGDVLLANGQQDAALENTGRLKPSWKRLPPATPAMPNGSAIFPSATARSATR
jgi:hypothetical protein